MSDTEDDIPEEFSIEREKEISENVEANLDVLSQKTVNFEDLLNELVSMGCLSFEDKYKIGVGAGDDPVILFKKNFSVVKFLSLNVRFCLNINL